MRLDVSRDSVQDVKARDLSHIERNLDKLLQTLADRCRGIFDEAAKGAARSTVRVAGWEIAPTVAPDDAPQSGGAASSSAAVIRERTVPEEDKASDYEFSTCCCSLTERIMQPDKFMQFLAIRLPHDGGRSYREHTESPS